MPKRATYANGDEVGLTANGCDGCSPNVIQGVFCHETGCPEAWRDQQNECFECGCLFYPGSRWQGTCDDCLYAQCEGLDYWSDPDTGGCGCRLLDRSPATAIRSHTLAVSPLAVWRTPPPDPKLAADD